MKAWFEIVAVRLLAQCFV